MPLAGRGRCRDCGTGPLRMRHLLASRSIGRCLVYQGQVRYSGLVFTGPRTFYKEGHVRATNHDSSHLG